MALSADLLSVRSAGVQRFEYDKSAISPVYNQTLGNTRLIVGFSKKGPFNRPIYIRGAAQFTSLFGSIDKSLEKKGSWFHRTCLTALNGGPIYALNLHAFDNTTTVDTKALCLGAGGKLNTWGSIANVYINSVFDTSKFYVPSPFLFKNFQIPGIIPCKEDDIVQETIIGGLSVFIEPITAGAELPLISSKKADVPFTPYTIKLEKIINTNTLVKPHATVTAIASVKELAYAYVTFNLDKLPADITDNAEYAFEYEAASDAEVRSYTVLIPITDGPIPDAKLTLDENGNQTNVNVKYSQDDKGNITISITGMETYQPTAGSKVTIKYNPKTFVPSTSNEMNIYTIDNSNENDPAADPNDPNAIPETPMSSELESVFAFTNVSKTPVTIFAVKESTNSVNMKSYNITLSDYYKGNYPDEVQEWIDNLNASNPETAAEPFDWGKVYKLKDFFWTVYILNGTYKTLPNSVINVLRKSTGFNTSPYSKEGEEQEINELEYVPSDPISLLQLMNANGINMIGKYTGITIPGFVDSTSTNISLDTQVNSDVDTTGIMMRMNEMTVGMLTDDVMQDRKNAIKDTTAVVQNDKMDYAELISGKTVAKPDVWVPTVIIDGIHGMVIPDGTKETQNLILNTICEYSEDTKEAFKNDEGVTVGATNMFYALADRNYIDWRYLVDGFGLGYEQNCKSQYSILCKKRKSGLAISNAPSAAMIMEDPSNIDPDTKLIDYSKFSINPNFSLPSEDAGATHAAYYYPYLEVIENGTTKNVPPAAYVSNLFMTKYKVGNEWDVVAGVRRGVINGVVGPETGLLQETDRDYLEPMGLNSIIFQQGIGTMIYANKTAKQVPISSLSSISGREVCITIQNNVEAILRNYVFEMNNAETRREIYDIVDNFMKGVKTAGGVLDYSIVMNKSNNTQEVIDNYFGIIDIAIETCKPMEKLVQRLTILKTGQIQAGDFTFA